MSAAEEALRKHAARLMAYPHVTGVGIGRQFGANDEGEAVVQVLVTEKLPPDQLAPTDIIPEDVDGVKVQVMEVGRLRFE